MWKGDKKEVKDSEQYETSRRINNILSYLGDADHSSGLADIERSFREPSPVYPTLGLSIALARCRG